MEEILAVTKHSINSNLNTPLNELVEQVTSNLEDYIRKNLIAGGYKLFTSSGTFTVPENVEQIYVTAIGSGASGGAGGTGYRSDTSSGGSSSYYGTGGGGGGGAGRYIKDQGFVVTSGQSIPITINPAGKEVLGGQPDSLLDLEAFRVNGNSGGSVIIGSLVTVAGGSYGYGAYGVKRTYSNEASTNSGGAGGGVNGKDGSQGGNGTSTTASAGTGGAGGICIGVFKGAYGKGGAGGSGVVGNSTSYHLGGSGSPGTTGAVLICWGGYRHDNLYT